MSDALIPETLKICEVCKSFVRILIIEDEQKLATALREGLQAEKYAVSLAHTGEEGFYQLHAEPFDLLILDIMLPGRSGLEVLKTLRADGIRIPVLILTAKDTTEDRVCGLAARGGNGLSRDAEEIRT